METPYKEKIEYVNEIKMVKKFEVKKDFSLKDYNTFDVDVKAKYFAEVANEENLTWLLSEYKNEDKLIIGEGSNILFVNDFDGLVIKLNVKGFYKIKESPHFIWIKAGSGERWHNLVEFCIINNYSGIENLSLIPGTVGAAPIQNIGAYGVELKDVFDHIEAMNIDNGNIEIFNKEKCKFGYRDSIFKNELKGKYIILNVVLRLRKKPKINLNYADLKQLIYETDIKEPTIREVSNAVIKLRNSKLPDYKKLYNAGSFFKNPEVDLNTYLKLKEKFVELKGHKVAKNKIKLSAAWLIEKAGWKGKRTDNVGTHKSHALVIVNYGNATGQEILAFSKNIQLAVKSKFLIDLEPEINII